jgi:signal transduction histidine kinase
LDFSKIEAGKLDIASIPFDLRENLGETMKGLRIRAHQKNRAGIRQANPRTSPVCYLWPLVRRARFWKAPSLGYLTYSSERLSRGGHFVLELRFRSG